MSRSFETLLLSQAYVYTKRLYVTPLGVGPVQTCSMSDTQTVGCAFISQNSMSALSCHA